jgi:DNA-binding MarR family transcriptional regulator
MHRTLPRPHAPPRTELNVMERQLLETLDRGGPSAIGNVRVRWPLIRMHVPVVLDRLLAAGLVRELRSPPGDGRAVAVTEKGRRLLRQLAGSSRASTPFGLSVRK